MQRRSGTSMAVTRARTVTKTLSTCTQSPMMQVLLPLLFTTDPSCVRHCRLSYILTCEGYDWYISISIVRIDSKRQHQQMQQQHHQSWAALVLLPPT